MTAGPTDRLDRIEAILQQVAMQQAANTVAISEVRQITESNARAVEANSNAISQMREELQQADERSRQRLEETTADVVDMIINLGQQLGESDQQVAETDNRFNVLLEEARADRQEWRQKFDEQIAEMRADRLSHATRFQAMQEVLQSHIVQIQRLWAEVQQIWQRLAG